MTRTQKIKIAKTGNLVFLSIQPIPYLSCKFENFWNFFGNFEQKKESTFFFCSIFGGGPSPPPKNASSVWDYFLGLVDPGRNRLASTGYQNNLFSVLHAWVGTFFFFSKVFEFTWKMRNVLYKKKTHFSSYGNFFTQNVINFQWIFTHKSKNESRKFFYYVFHSFEHILHLS